MKMDSIFQIVSKVFKSRTLVVNWLALVASTVTLWTNSEMIQQYPEVVAILGSALAGANLVLRWMTSLPLSAK
jgi:hypothetical protein